MTNKIITLVGIIGVLFVLFLAENQKKVSVFGGVNRGNEYIATSTRAANIGTSIGNPITLCATPGALGSVVITGANTGVINFYDGTSTAAHSDYATTTLATIPASTVAGDYIFDVVAIRGLVMETLGTVATATVTYRCN